MLNAKLIFKADIAGTDIAQHGQLLSLLTECRSARLVDGGTLAVLPLRPTHLHGQVRGILEAVVAYYQFLRDLSIMPLEGISFRLLYGPQECCLKAEDLWAVRPPPYTTSFTVMGFSSRSVRNWMALHPHHLSNVTSVNLRPIEPRSPVAPSSSTISFDNETDTPATSDGETER